MTATSVPVRSRPSGAGRAAPPTMARLLRVELRRNAMPWVLPLIAALFWFDSYRPSTTLPDLWVMRMFYILGQGHSLVDFAPFVAGVAAWMGSRDGRRGMSDLVTATVRPRWEAQLATWAATACWAVGAYLVFMGVLLGVTARSITWGGPPWWSVAVGAVGVAAFTIVGFAAGAYFPSRFTAPVTAFGALLAMGTSSQIGFSHYSGWALILPTNSNSNFGQDAGIFYPFLPDLPIARVMFLAGVAVAAVGLLGLPVTAGGPRLRQAAAVITAAGLVVVGTAVGLAATAQVGPYGTVIPALHDAANDRPLSYTPFCGQAGIPVCLNPAYRASLPDVTAALRPVAREITGLPGAPVRSTQIATVFESGQALKFGPTNSAIQVETISGRPPVLRLPLNALTLPGSFGADTAQFTGQIRLQFVHAFVGAGAAAGSPAQQAIQAALLQGAGVPFAAQPLALAIDGLPPSGPSSGNGPGPASGPVYAAARRFAALPAPTRHAWLAAHLAALRAGQITLARLP